MAWKSLARIDLESLTVTEIITGFTGEWDGAWITELHSVRADATSLSCTVGRVEARPGGNGHGGESYSAEYFLCRLDVATATLEPVTQLRNIFF